MTQKQNVLISLAVSKLANAGTSASVNYYLTQVPFTPDEVIIRGFSWADTGSSTECLILSTSLSNNQPILQVPLTSDLRTVGISYFSTCSITLPLNRQITGTQTFVFIDPSNDAARIISGFLSLNLEFVKY